MMEPPPHSIATFLLVNGLSTGGTSLSEEIERELKKFGVDMDQESIDELVEDLVRKIKRRRVERSSEGIRKELEERGLLDE